MQSIAYQSPKCLSVVDFSIACYFKMESQVDGAFAPNGNSTYSKPNTLKPNCNPLTKPVFPLQVMSGIT